MGFLKSKVVLAVTSFVLSFLVIFIIIPKNNEQEIVKVVKTSKIISANTLLTDDMLTTVSVDKLSVPAGSITDKNEIVGKYSITNIYPEDYITVNKVSDVDTTGGLHVLKDGETAVSLTLDSLAHSVSGKIIEGDAVWIYAYDNETKQLNPNSGKWCFEVLEINNSKGQTIEEAKNDGSSDALIPQTVVLRAKTMEQTESLTFMENRCSVQIVFAGRGEKAQQLLNPDLAGGIQ